jgi:uncharacterized damage-inducible protein DinB
MTPLHFRRLAAYDAWANRALAAPLTDALRAACRLLAHVAEAERVWLGRIHGTQPVSMTADFWPEDDAASCAARVEAAAEALQRFTAGLAEADLARTVTYHNSQGVAYHTPIGEILQHVFLHGQYHRGQVAAELRRADLDPPATDYIAWQRLGAPGAPDA